MNLNRRGFLGAVAGALIAKPTLEQIEQITWKRRYFPGWRPTLSIDEFSDRYIRPAALTLADRTDIALVFALSGPKIGHTINVRRPQRFVGRLA